MKALLVDDNALIRKMLRTVLEAEGVECHERGDLAGAMEATLQIRPDWCFLDLHLPDGEGLDLLRRFRAIEGAATLPRVVLLTGSDTEGLAAQSLRLGAHAVLFKPIHPGQILAVIRGS
jgi:DNA-binding response OmpR family regulator